MGSPRTLTKSPLKWFFGNDRNNSRALIAVGCFVVVFWALSTHTVDNVELTLPSINSIAPPPSPSMEISMQNLTVKRYWLEAGNRNSEEHAERNTLVKYNVGKDELTLKSECGTPFVIQERFEKQFDKWVDTHLNILAGVLPPRFVHVGIPGKSSFINRIKVVTSAVMVAFLSNRAMTVSWMQVLDPASQHRHHEALDALFDMPAFNWTHDVAKYQQDEWDRYNVTGFGLEEYVELEPVHRLFCMDIMHHLNNTVWWEVFWRYGWFGALMYHSPYMHHITAQYFVKDDMFGPIARKIFKPRAHIWRRIRYYREQHFLNHTIVGVEFTGDAHQLESILELIDEEGGKKEPADMVSLERTKLFLVSRNESVMHTIIERYGKSDQLLYYPHKNFSSPGDQGRIIDMWLFGMCDKLYATADYTSAIGALFSRRVNIVKMVGQKKVRLSSVQDVQCQPCISVSGVSKTTCYDEGMAFPESPFHCEREYPIF